MPDILSGDIISVEDITNRVEELEDDIEQLHNDNFGGTDYAEELQNELACLTSVLDELCGYGGDHQWRGDWYPDTLIADDHFTDFARELVEDCYSLKLPDFVEIDWEATAENVKEDYSMVDIGGNTYWYR